MKDPVWLFSLHSVPNSEVFHQIQLLQPNKLGSESLHEKRGWLLPGVSGSLILAWDARAIFLEQQEEVWSSLRYQHIVGVKASKLKVYKYML